MSDHQNLAKEDEKSNEDGSSKKKKLQTYDQRLFNQQREQISNSKPFVDQISNESAGPNHAPSSHLASYSQGPTQPQPQPHLALASYIPAVNIHHVPTPVPTPIVQPNHQEQQQQQQQQQHQQLQNQQQHQQQHQQLQNQHHQQHHQHQHLHQNQDQQPQHHQPQQLQHLHHHQQQLHVPHQTHYLQPVPHLSYPAYQPGPPPPVNLFPHQTYPVAYPVRHHSQMPPHHMLTQSQTAPILQHHQQYHSNPSPAQQPPHTHLNSLPYPHHHGEKVPTGSDYNRQGSMHEFQQHLDRSAATTPAALPMMTSSSNPGSSNKLRQLPLLPQFPLSRSPSTSAYQPQQFPLHPNYRPQPQIHHHLPQFSSFQPQFLAEPQPAPTSSFVEKVVHEYPKPEAAHFFPLERSALAKGRAFGESSSEGEEEQGVELGKIGNSIYSEQYLRSLMKKLPYQMQESSELELIKLCQVLELECCLSRTEGFNPHVCDPLESMLLSKFVDYTAPWLDLYCHLPIFTKYLTQLSLYEDGMMIHNCILSCGLLYLHRDQPEKFGRKFALKYYNAALKLLSMQILQNDRVLMRCLISSILLNHYEDFAGQLQNRFSHHTGSRIILQEILNSESAQKKKKLKAEASGAKSDPNSSKSDPNSSKSDPNGSKSDSSGPNSGPTSDSATSSTVTPAPQQSNDNDHKQIDLKSFYSLDHNEFIESLFWVVTNNDLQELLKWEVPTRWSLQNPNTTVLSMAPNIEYEEKISEYVSNNFDVDFKKMGDQFFNQKDQLWWLRESAYNLQLVNDYCNQPYVVTFREYKDNQMMQKWIELKKMVDIFGKFVPLMLRKIIYRPPHQDLESRFPVILYKDAQATMVNLNYHLSCFLLYDSLIKRSGLYSPDEEERLSSEEKILNVSDKELLTCKKSLRSLLKQHAVSIVGIINSCHRDNVVWSLSLGHFKIALKYLRKYDEYHNELRQLVTEIQLYTKTRFNRV